MIKPPVRGGRADTVWQQVAQISGGLADIQAGAQKVNDDLYSRKDALDSIERMHPFKLYQLPAVLRATPNASADWLKFRVRAGRVYISNTPANVANTDGFNVDPDAEDYGANIANIADISVPSNTASYKVWIDISGSNAVVNHSANGWSGWPTMSESHIPIGEIDTQTHLANATAVVRQILRADVLMLGSGATLEKMYRIKSVRQDYLVVVELEANGNEGSTNIYVAKKNELRGSISSENIDGITISYNSYSNTWAERLASWTESNVALTEVQVVQPRYGTANGPDSVIYAVELDGGTGLNTASPDTANIAITMVEHSGREWCRRWQQ